jgi:hypothetical protein
LLALGADIVSSHQSSDDVSSPTGAPRTSADGAGHTTRRGLIFALLCVGCLVVAIGYAFLVVPRSPTVPEQAASLTASIATSLSSPPTGGRVLFRRTALGEGYGKVASAPVEAPTGPIYPTTLECDRVYFAEDRGICLMSDRGVITTYRGIIFDDHFESLSTFDLSGIPSRARISPDGKYAAMTVFVTGHGYDGGGFSTRTTIVDTSTGSILLDLEDLAVRRDGAPFKAVDFNFWGVTFARDSRRFYATLGTAGQTYLIEGDLTDREAHVVYEGLECPSLSPDNTRIAFKKQIGTNGLSFWQLRVLDLATLTETPLAGETKNVDDQAEWLDDEHVLYGLPDSTDAGASTASTSVWVMSADGTGAPRLFIPHAASPAIVR